jgi:hypothetical protein
MQRLTVVSSIIVFGALLAAARQQPINARFDPASFKGGPIDNPFFPLKPGTVYVYEVRDGGDVEVDSVTVTSETKRVAGVTAVVVHDRARRNGTLIEDTFDWYAQDTTGTVWYLGEDTKAYKLGRIASSSGSWEAGVKGAQAGIIMLANPRPGVTYRQEYRQGVAEDMGKVVSVGDSVTVPTGRYTKCLTTEDWSPLEPKVREHKTYCPGVGVVLERTIAGGSERSELVAIRNP